MDILLKRFSDDGDSTLGLFFIDGKFSCFTLEDEYRKEKVHGETCIPEGNYNVIFQQLRTPKTIKYRNRYSWFDKHLMLEDVVGFSTIYIHIGNVDEHTEGCILLGDSSVSNVTKDGFIGNSKNAFKRVYAEVCDALGRYEPVRIKIENIKGQK